MRYESILDAIGRTPLVRLHKIGKDLNARFYAKLEFTNPGGSIKDRIAVKMVEAAEREGKLKPGGTIVEATAGNTGVGLAMVAAVKGYRCVFVMPDKMSADKINQLKAFGAEVVITPTSVSPDSPEAYNNVADRLAREIPGAIRAGQFTNPLNPQAHYATTGPEIWHDTNGEVDVVVGGVGTGGTITGIGQYLKEKKPSCKIVVADPVGSIISGIGEEGFKSWLVEGVGEDFIPATYNRQVVDETIRISDRESFTTGRRLAREEGIFAGGSSGMIVAAAMKYAERLQGSPLIVVLIPDTGRNYLTKMYNDQWMQEHDFFETPMIRVPIGEILKQKKSGLGIVSLDRDSSIMDAIKLLHKHNFSQLPVIDGDEVLGSIKESTIMKMLHDGINLANQKVTAVMGKPFTMVDPMTDSNEVYRQFLSGQDAVIVAEMGSPRGIVTRIDLVDYWLKEKMGS